MTGEPEGKTTDGKRDSTLDYATRVGTYPQKTSHPPVVLFVLMLTALAGIWSVILGATSLGDIRLVGLLQIGAGVCLCWGTIGKLSATNLRPKGALGVLIAGIALLLAVAALANQAYAAEQAKHPNFQLSDQGKIIRLPSEVESEIFTFAMIRDSASVSAGLGGICCVYSVMRMRKDHGAMSVPRE